MQVSSSNLTIFQNLRTQCQNFATALLDHTRSSAELEVLLNHDPSGPVYQHGDRMHLNRLKLAIKYRQKKVSFHICVHRAQICEKYMGLPQRYTNTMNITHLGERFQDWSLGQLILANSTWQNSVGL